MSGGFEFEKLVRGGSNRLEGPTPRQLRIGCGLGLAVLLVVLLTGMVGPYTDYLWFVHDARHPEVYLTAYAVRGRLFVIGFVVVLAVIYLNLARALKGTTIYERVPQTPAEVFLSNAVDFVQHNTARVSKGVSVGLALLFALGLQGEWNTVLLASNRQAFNQPDPLFGLDLGFYVFTLPWLEALARFAFSVLLITTVLTTTVYVGMKAMASLAKIELARPAERAHIAALTGVTVIVYALQLWLSRYDFGLMDSQQFTGAGYAGIRELFGVTVLSVLFAGVGVGSIVFGAGVRTVRPILIVGAVCIAATLVVRGIVPGVTQKGWVEPNKFAAEGPYTRSAIKMTRFAYGLDAIEIRETQVIEEPTAEEIAASGPTIDNMRLWDPEVLKRSIEGIQGLRPYYTFPDVDVDRYTLDGRQTLVMLAARDIRLDGLSSNARTWVNERLQYTHGFGLTMSPVNTATPIGQPNFVIKDLPPKTPPGLDVTEPRLYFSDFEETQGDSSGWYAIVDTKIDEFDYPGQDTEKKYRWKGDRGVPIGTPLARLAYAISLSDGNLLVSGNITPATRLLYRRGVRERSALIYPFLRFDSDPYLVVYEGRLLWLLDGYTVTGQIPYSARLRGDGEHLNYIRNSVKVVIDAYSGETTAYAIEPDEPILKAYRAIYPALVKDLATLPKGLDSHFRYPEDLFSLQSIQLRQYHVTDTTMFLNNEDAWDMAVERGIDGASAQMRPYYVQLQLPGDKASGFMLILPFTPREKGNLSGWLAAHCDPGSYGSLVLYKYPKGSNIAGPSQMEARFNQDPVISDLNRQLSNDQSKIIVGNLLVIPIGKSVMYVEPMFLESRTASIQPIPELKKVILGMNTKVVVGDTYSEALQKLFGGTSPAPRAPDVPGGEKPVAEPGVQDVAPGVDATKLAEVMRLLDAQDAALRDGDFARFGELRKQLKARLGELVGKGR